MKSNYFNSSVIVPTVAASKLHAAFATGDIVFDWMGFEIPRGVAKLLGASISLRAKNDAGQTVQPAGLALMFAQAPSPDAAPTSLGTVNGEITNFATTDVIGVLPATTETVGVRTLYQTTVSPAELVLEPNVNSGSNVGVDKYYIAGIAAGNLDFTSALTVNETNFGAGTQTVITVADVDATLGFAAGDVIHAQDDAVLGTIQSVDSTTQITLTAANTAAIEDDDVLYNINPIRITLHFSK
jgi:hypothetical protein